MRILRDDIRPRKFLSQFGGEMIADHLHFNHEFTDNPSCGAL
jgi:hypothetical protein